MKKMINRKYFIVLLFLLFISIQISGAQEISYEKLWTYEVEDWVDGGGPSISSDGSFIAVASRDGTLYALDNKGNKLWSRDLKKSVQCVSVSPDGSYIAAGTWEMDDYYGEGNGVGKIYLFKNDGDLLWKHNAGKVGNGIYDVSVSRNAEYVVATLLGEPEIDLYAKNGDLLWSSKANDFTGKTSISSDGSYVAIGNGNGNLNFIDQERNILWNYSTDFGYFIDIAVSFDGSYTAAISSNKHAYFFDKNGNLLWKYKIDSDLGVLGSVSVSHDAFYVAILSDDDIILLNRDGKMILNFENGDSHGDISISSDGSFITTSHGSEVYLFGDLERHANNTIKTAKLEISKSILEGFNMEKSENLILLSEEAYRIGDYKKSGEIAEQALNIALDIDNDGVSNDSDFLPTIDNKYIYYIVLIFIVGTVFFGWNRIKSQRKDKGKQGILDVIKHVTQENEGNK